jgi:hypothetical protein
MDIISYIFQSLLFRMQITNYESNYSEYTNSNIQTYHWMLTFLEVSGFAVEDSSLLGCDSVAG